TKTKCIITNVFLPYAVNVLKKDLFKCNFVSIMTDASNHNSQKIIPILVRYFLPDKGVKNNILEFNELPGETASLLTQYISSILHEWGIESKVIAFSADNTNCNFGGVARNGKNNVFYKLKEIFNKDLIGVGCAAHILNNAVQTAADTLPIDVQVIIGKIFQHFYIYTVRVHALKEFCEFVNIEYKTVLGHSKTRWLSLFPALTRLIDMFDGLKSYFLSIDKCPTLIKNFFNNPLSYLILIFLQIQCELFFTCIKSVEAKDISIIEVKHYVESITKKIESRKNENFFTSKEREVLNSLRDEAVLSENIYIKYRNTFYDTCLEYIKEWSNPTLSKFDGITWITLKNIDDDFNWVNIQATIELIKNIIPNKNLINEAHLFDEFTMIKESVKHNVEHIQSLKTLSEKWTYIFKSMNNNSINGFFPNFKIIVEFIICIPGSNANVERIFSNMNNLWTDEKNKMEIKTVKAMLIVKTFFKETCTEFHDFLIGNQSLSILNILFLLARLK
ncbi:protein FAM200B-like, partial [Aphis craccivora]